MVFIFSSLSCQSIWIYLSFLFFSFSPKKYFEPLLGTFPLIDAGICSSAYVALVFLQFFSLSQKRLMAWMLRFALVRQANVIEEFPFKVMFVKSTYYIDFWCSLAAS